MWVGRNGRKERKQNGGKKEGLKEGRREGGALEIPTWNDMGKILTETCYEDGNARNLLMVNRRYTECDRKIARFFKTIE